MDQKFKQIAMKRIGAGAGDDRDGSSGAALGGLPGGFGAELLHRIGKRDGHNPAGKIVQMVRAIQAVLRAEQ